MDLLAVGLDPTREVSHGPLAPAQAFLGALLAVITINVVFLENGSSAEAVREPALRAAATATRVLEGTANLSVSVIVGQIRSTATDLLTGIGYTYEEATDAFREASAT